MPEIYFCCHNLAYGLKIFCKNDNNFSQQLKDFEFRFEMNMEQNRIKLFGY